MKIFKPVIIDIDAWCMVHIDAIFRNASKISSKQCHMDAW